MTMTRKLATVALILLVIAVPSTSCMAGHFALAFQRKAGAWENSGEDGSCGGGRAARVWVWDEEGKPMPNILLKTSWDVTMGQTDKDGRCEVNFSTDIGFDLVCVDGQGSSSDIAYEMTSWFEPCKDLHLFEVGYLYKTDASNPGTFDTELNCTWPQMYGYCDDAAYTKSLAFSGIDCTDFMSDQQFGLGTWQGSSSYFGQTFVATGDRVVAARVHGTIGANYTLDWNLQIVTYPGLEPVGPNIAVPYRSDPDPYRFPFGWEGFWGVNDCPVVPGQTYMLQVSRGGSGMNIWHIKNNVYPHGEYYEGTTAFDDRDLDGHICCMNYGTVEDVDLNGDGKVNFKDYSSLSRYWQQNEPSVDIAPPPTGDDMVDFKDLAFLIENWLTATTIPPLPEQASNPYPPDGATDVNTATFLSWTAGARAISHDVYIGTGNPPLFIRNQTAATVDPGAWPGETKFYWRIDEVNGWGKTEGTVWSFTTGATEPPPPPPPPPPP